MAVGLLLLPALVQAQTWLRDFDDGIHTLDEFTGNGQWTVVMFWASDCTVCNREVHHYVDFHHKHGQKDAVVVGVSLDGKAKQAAAQAFIDRHKVNFTNLIGEPERVAGLYYDLVGESFKGTPTFLIFAPYGELKARQVGAVPTELIEKFMARKAEH